MIILTKKFKYYNYNYSIMTTTIQVSDTTKQLLEKLKEKEHARSYDEVIKDLAEKKMRIKKSMFGSVPGLKWQKKYRLDFDEE
jgi:predicted CopG family antitoxin